MSEQFIPKRMSDAYDPLDYDNLAKSIVGALLNASASTLPPDPFAGSGVYALYYAGDLDIYREIASSDLATPIYVGKADAGSTRRGSGTSEPHVPQRRLRDHAKSIDAAVNLSLADFRYRRLVVVPVWISLAEQFLLRHFQPVWNTIVDGFGNHDPGRGRAKMRRPRWDIVHPGRVWAGRLRAEETADEIAGRVRERLLRSVQS